MGKIMIFSLIIAIFWIRLIEATNNTTQATPLSKHSLLWMSNLTIPGNIDEEYLYWWNGSTMLHGEFPALGGTAEVITWQSN